MKPIERPLVALIVRQLKVLLGRLTDEAIDCPDAIKSLEEVIALCDMEIADAKYRQALALITIQTLQARKLFREAGFNSIADEIRTIQTGASKKRHN